MPIGFRILPRQRAVSEAYVERFNHLPVANVSDCMLRVSAGGPRLRPMHKSGRLGGPALTVKTRPGDNLMIHKAIDMAEPGDIIVVDGGGDLTNSLIGEIMVSHAMRRGVGGFVINGAIRDADEILALNLPVYAAGVTHRGPYKDGPGEINVCVALDGMIVQPGDLMIGDGDGVHCVPYEEVESVCAASEAKLRSEEQTMHAIQADSLDRSWVDETLRRLGCEGV
ncbi:MAG: RraA family protein [Gammaproteobacteria bacterium]|nr:RraA family protein [Gammaproteobacteria bacterium]